MGIWLSGWAGDNAGKIIGRQPNTLLITLTETDGEFPSGLFQEGNLLGVPWFYNVYVSCVAPGTRDAIAISVDQVSDSNDAWSIGLAEVDFGTGLSVWKTGINLFAITLQTMDSTGNAATTFATAEIDGKIKQIDASKMFQGFSPPWLSVRRGRTGSSNKSRRG